eukprot:14688783-Alexandrium_andersonii.AAC.1
MPAAAQAKPPPPKLPARLAETDGASARGHAQPADGGVDPPAKHGRPARRRCRSRALSCRATRRGAQRSRGRGRGGSCA